MGEALDQPILRHVQAAARNEIVKMTLAQERLHSSRADDLFELRGLSHIHDGRLRRELASLLPNSSRNRIEYVAFQIANLPIRQTTMSVKVVEGSSGSPFFPFPQPATESGQPTKNMIGSACKDLWKMPSKGKSPPSRVGPSSPQLADHFE